MEFMGVGLPELLVILVITLLIVGPNRLPEMAVQIARAMREFRRYSSSLTRDVTEALEDLEKEYTSVQEEWKDVGEAVTKDVKAMEEQVSGAVEDARTGLNIEERSAGERPTSEKPSGKVVSMEDAASRRTAASTPEGAPPDDDRSASQGGP